ncbi:MAG: alpha/beta hydrolase [Polyangiaceae bacterium]|nr:alpha/beta hydrolase [Polyangiaceae bacterium]
MAVGDQPSLQSVRDVNARGVRTRAVTAGNPKKPVLLLLHDFLVSHITWEDVMDKFAENFFVVAPDLPGFGESEKPNPARYAYTIESLAEAVVDVIAALNVGRASIVGHGLGAAIAITLAAEHAELVQRLVLEDALCYPPPRKISPQFAHFPVLGGIFFKQFYSRSMFRSYCERLMLGPKAVVPLSRIDTHYDLLSTPNARESAHAVMNAMFETRPVVARLGRIQTPALVVWGHDDRLLPVSHGQRLAHEMTGAKLQILDAGHTPHEEVPDLFAQHTTQFLLGKR